MPGSPKKRARRLAAAGLTPKVEETAPPDFKKGKRETYKSEKIPPPPADGAAAPSTAPTVLPSSPDHTPAWLKESAARIEAAEAREREVLAILDKRLAAESIVKGEGPTEYHEAHCDAVLELGRIGMEVVEISVRFGVLKNTLYDWCRKHEDFARAFARAREACEAYHTAIIREQMARPNGAGNAAAYMSYMARRFRGDWREVKEIEHNVTVSHEDRLERRMRVISERRRVIDVTPETKRA